MTENKGDDFEVGTNLTGATESTLRQINSKLTNLKLVGSSQSLLVDVNGTPLSTVSGSLSVYVSNLASNLAQETGGNLDGIHEDIEVGNTSLAEIALDTDNLAGIKADLDILSANTTNIDVVDSSGNGNNGMFIGSLANRPQYIISPFGSNFNKALQFNGVYAVADTGGVDFGNILSGLPEIDIEIKIHTGTIGGILYSVGNPINDFYILWDSGNNLIATRTAYSNTVLGANLGGINSVLSNTNYTIRYCRKIISGGTIVAEWAYINYSQTLDQHSLVSNLGTKTSQPNSKFLMVGYTNNPSFNGILEETRIFTTPQVLETDLTYSNTGTEYPPSGTCLYHFNGSQLVPLSQVTQQITNQILEDIDVDIESGNSKLDTLHTDLSTTIHNDLTTLDTDVKALEGSGNKTLTDIVNAVNTVNSTLAANLDYQDSFWIDGNNNFFVRIRHSDGTVTYTTITGSAYTPVNPVYPAASQDRILRTTSYKATANGTGFSTGDYILETDIVDASVNPAIILGTIWFNRTTGAAINAPGYANITPYDEPEKVDQGAAGTTSWKFVEDNSASIKIDLDNLNTVTGLINDVAVTSDANGTISAKLRGLVKIFANVWDNVNGQVKAVLGSSGAVIGTVNRNLTLDKSGSGSITGLCSNEQSCPVGSYVTVPVNGATTIQFNVSGTFVATIHLDGTIDGVQWDGINGQRTDDGSDDQITFFANSIRFKVKCGGLQQVRLYASAYTSGTVNVTWNLSEGDNTTSIAIRDSDNAEILVGSNQLSKSLAVGLANDQFGLAADPAITDVTTGSTYMSFFKGALSIFVNIWDSVNKWFRVYISFSPTSNILSGSSSTNGATIITVPANKSWRGWVQVTASLAVGVNAAAVNANVRVDWTPGTNGTPAYTVCRVDLSTPVTLLSATVGADSVGSSNIFVEVYAGTSSGTLKLNQTGCSQFDATISGVTN